ncbi:MAG: mechanosensitive ion channel domain-containing protein [Gemmatimonadota bacterium]
MSAPRISSKMPRAGRTHAGRRLTAAGLRTGRAGARGAVLGARRSLRGTRQASIVAVAVTGFLLLSLGLDDVEAIETAPVVGQTTEIEELPGQPEPQVEEPQTQERGEVVGEVLGEAHQTAFTLWNTFVGNLPRYIVASLVLLLAGLLVWVLRPLLRRALGQWERAQAFTALAGVLIWVFALGIAVSVLVGDVRALVGSLGLIGLALSWALQTPIESFTGWLMNGMRGYYRVGDRVAVGEVMGDVYRIDFFTTTVWEIGGLGRPGVFVSAEQPTGRMITFPNNEVLTGSIVNFTRDFPWVWDELTISVGNESELGYAMKVLSGVAEEIVGEGMAGPAEAYETLLRQRRLESSIPRGPQIFVSLADSWTDLSVRYLVNARERRTWKSRLAQAAMEAFNDPVHEGRILPVYPLVVGADGRLREASELS